MSDEATPLFGYADPRLGQMRDAIIELVCERGANMPLATVLGVLRLVEYSLVEARKISNEPTLAVGQEWRVTQNGRWRCIAHCDEKDVWWLGPSNRPGVNHCLMSSFRAWIVRTGATLKDPT